MALTKTGQLNGKPTGNAETAEGQGGDKQRSRFPSNPIVWFAGLPVAEQSKIGGKVKAILSLYTLARMEQRENDEFDEYDDDISNTCFATQFLELKMAYALAAIQSHFHDKVASGQTKNIVLNLADSICEAANINSHFSTNHLRGLENIIVLVHRLAYNGDVVAFKMGRRQGARRAHI